MLCGLMPVLGVFNDGESDELASEHHLACNPVLTLSEFCYLARKLQGRFFAGEYAAAVDSSLRPQPLLWSVPSPLETADFRFYGVLAHAASWDCASADERARHFEALITHCKQLEVTGLMHFSCWLRKPYFTGECRLLLRDLQLAVVR